MTYKGCTAKETKPCRYCHCPHCTSQSTTSSQGYSTTIAQMPKVSHQHIAWVQRYPDAPASQGWWRPQCSSTKGRWRSQSSSTPKGYFWGSETVHGGNRMHRDSLAKNFRWKIPDGWRSLKMSRWSSRSLARISRCYWRWNIGLPIARWSISQKRSANARRCQCIFCFLLLYWSYDDAKPGNLHG